jgi:uncharacterized protein YjbI with pentapeptide repeats
MIEISQDELLSRYAAGERNFSAVNIKRDYTLRGNVKRTERLGFFDVDLQGINLSGSDLRWTSFIRCNLSEANLSGVNLDGGIFHEANLEKANATGIILSHCTIKLSNFRHADLTGACFYRTECICVDFTGSDMRYSSWTQCHDLDDSDFSRVDLEMATLIDVDFSKADILGFDTEDAFVYNVTWSEQWCQMGPKYIH